MRSYHKVMNNCNDVAYGEWKENVSGKVTHQESGQRVLEATRKMFLLLKC